MGNEGSVPIFDQLEGDTQTILFAYDDRVMLDDDYVTDMSIQYLYTLVDTVKAPIVKISTVVQPGLEPTSVGMISPRLEITHVFDDWPDDKAEEKYDYLYITDWALVKIEDINEFLAKRNLRMKYGIIVGKNSPKNIPGMEKNCTGDACIFNWPHQAVKT